MKKKEVFIAVGIVLIAILSFYVGTMFGGSRASEQEFQVMPEEEVKNNVETFVREVMQGAEDAVVLEVIDQGALYLVRFDWEGDGESVFDAFVSKDGRYLISDAFDLTADITSDFEIEEVPEADLSMIERADDKIDVLYFWTEGCPFCDDMSAFFEEFEERNPGVLNLQTFEISNDEELALFFAVGDAYNDDSLGVPKVFFGDNVFVGASEEVLEDIENTLFSECVGLREECQLLV